MIKNLLRCNLQFFAEDTGGQGAVNPNGNNSSTDTNTSTNNDQPTDDQKPDNKTFSRDELAKVTSAQVQQALEKFQSEKLPDLIKQAREEGRNEASMSAKELAEKHAKEREAALDKKAADLDHREIVSDTKDLLTDMGLPADKLTNIITEQPKNADERKEWATTIKDIINDGIHDGILKKTAGKQIPISGNTSTTQNNDSGSLGKRLAQMANASANQKSNYF